MLSDCWGEIKSKSTLLHHTYYARLNCIGKLILSPFTIWKAFQGSSQASLWSRRRRTRNVWVFSALFDTWHFFKLRKENSIFDKIKARHLVTQKFHLEKKILLVYTGGWVSVCPKPIFFLVFIFFFILGFNNCRFRESGLVKLKGSYHSAGVSPRPPS